MAFASSRLGSSVDHQLIWDLGYELLELASSGPHCDIWRVRDRATYQVLAWKQIRPEWEVHPAVRSELENEAAVGELVDSPLLLKLVASHVTERPCYLIWEWFEGRTLDQLIHEYRRLPIRSALWFVRQCAQGLDDLLHAGLIHGNLRAEHILVENRTGLVKLTELGSSRRDTQSREFESNFGARVSGGPLDDYESIVSPPHLQGGAGDLYQLGVILFRSLAGRLPFEFETAAEVLRGQPADVAQELRRIRSDIPAAVADVVGTLLSSEPLRPIARPAELVNRLVQLEVDELAKLAPPRGR